MKNIGMKLILSIFADLMQDHGLVGEIDEWLGHAERQRPQASAKASDENEGLHGRSAPNSTSATL
jgi:hypothetical protein